MSTLTAFPFIEERSEATPGLWNQPLSIISANIRAAAEGPFSSSTQTFSFSTNIDVTGSGHFQQLSIGSTPPSVVTTAAITVAVNSAFSDYLYLTDSSGARSNYVIGSRAGGTADGLNIWDASGATMIASFSKQSIRFWQNVVGPVFDVGGALAKTLNAATFGTGADSKESRIQAAILAAPPSGASRVYVPANMYPYSASSISFLYQVQMVREGGDWSVYDVLAYGARGDGTGSDRTAAQMALNAVSTNSGGGTVYFPAGTYPLESAVTGPDHYCLYIGSFTRLELDPHATLSYNSTDTLANIVFSSTAGGTTSLVTGNVPWHSSIITLTSATGFAVGNDIELFDNNNFEINRIQALAGTVVTLEQPTTWSYTTAAAVAAQQWAFTDRSLIVGGVINGNNKSGNAIEMFHCRNMTVDGVKISNTSIGGRGIEYAGITHNSRVVNCEISNVGDRGIEFYVTTSHNLIAHNVISAASIHGVALHGNFNTALGNSIRGSGTTGQAYAGLHVDTAKGCQVLSNRVVASPARGIQADGSTISELVLSNNEVFSAKDVGIYLNAVQGATLTGNRVLRSESIGIFLSAVTRAVVVGNQSSHNSSDGFRFNAGDDLVIVGNDFSANSTYGIRFVTSPVRAAVMGNNLEGNFTDRTLGNVGHLDVTGGTLFAGNARVQVTDSTGSLVIPVLRRVGTYSAGSTTPNVNDATFLQIANASITTITGFANGVQGQPLTLKFDDNRTVITRADAFLRGSSNFSSTANATLVLVRGSANWFECSRETNNG